MLADKLEVLKAAALGAGEIALQYFRQDPEVWEKGDGQGPVTEADLAVNAFLHRYFAEHLPDSHILSEEDEDDPARLEARALIVVDPIDGTKAFIEGQDFFSVSIGYFEAGELVAGVVHAPALGELYWASQNGGAFCNGQKLSVGDCDDLHKAKILASRARYNRDAIDKAPPLATIFRPSVALRLAWVAAGRYDLTFGLRLSWDWDVAAGDLLVREAGGVFVDQDGRRPVYNQLTPRQNGIVAGTKILVEDFLKRI